MTKDNPSEVQRSQHGSSFSGPVAGFARKLSNLFKEPFLTVLILAFLVYSFVWSYIGIAKFYALQSSVYDLGISMQTAYEIIHFNWTILSFLTYLIARNGLAVFMSPVSLTASYPLMISIQALFVGAAVFPLYGISLRSGLSKFESLLVASSYLIYYPLNGLVWFDFHYQMFFVFLFPLGYYLYIRGMLRSALVVFVLSGFTRYPFMVFPFLFSILLLIELAVGRHFNRPVNWRTLYFAIALLMITVSILLTGYFLIGGISTLPLHTGSSTGVFITFSAKWFTLFMLLAPVLFIPVLSYRWYLLELPFLFLLFISSSGTYSYPPLFLRQYSSGIVPFLYLGLIDGLGKLPRLSEWLKNSIRKIWRPKVASGASGKRFRRLKRITVKRAGIVLMIVVMASASLFYQPYGPFNDLTDVNFHLSYATDVNSTIFNSLQSVLSLIPKGEPHVLIQNNIVEALPGPIGRIMLVPQYNVGPNITLSNIQNNSFPYREGTKTGQTPINYAVVDVNEQNTLLQSGLTGYPTMLEICQQLVTSGYYGIRTEQNNIVLLQRGYTGQTLFIPFHAVYGVKEFRSANGSLSRGVLSIVNPIAGSIMWYGPFTNPYVDYLSLSPGTYQATFDLATDNNSGSNNIQLIAGSNGGAIVFNNTTVSGKDLGAGGAWTGVTLNLTVNNFVSNLELLGRTGSWSGTLLLKQIELKQVSPFTKALAGPVVGMTGILVPPGTTVTASSYLGNYTPGNAIDGNLLTSWITTNYSGNLTLKFPGTITLTGIELAAGSNPVGNFSITIQGYNTSWVALYTGQRFVSGGSSGYAILLFHFPQIQCTSLTISCISNQSLIRINEITLLEAI